MKTITIDGVAYEVVEKMDAASLPNLRHEMDSKDISHTLYLKRPTGQTFYQVHVYHNDHISHVMRLF